MSEFPRATPGGSANLILDSRWYNRVTEAVSIVERLAGSSGLGRDSIKKLPVRCKIRNDSGSDVPPGGVLKISDVVFTPTDRATIVFDGLLFAGDTPAVNEKHVAICEEPIADGRFGQAIIPCAAWAKVNVSDAAHTHATPKASVAELKSDSSTGFPIIWKQSGTGAGKWAVVSLGGGGSAGSTLQYAEVTTTVTPGTSWGTPGSGTVQPKDIEGLDDGPPVDVVNFRPEQFDVGYIVVFDPNQVDSLDRRLLIDGVCAGY